MVGSFWDSLKAHVPTPTVEEHQQDQETSEVFIESLKEASNSPLFDPKDPIMMKPQAQNKNGFQVDCVLGNRQLTLVSLSSCFFL